jgi:hypothetical protein
MANPWFRVYAEFATDAKVQSMPEAMQRRLMMLFCLRCSNVLATLQDDEIAHAMRVTDDELAETKALFLRKRFITDDWIIRKWNERQFASDLSTERSRKHRNGKKESMQRRCNVDATPPDTDTDTDTDKKKDIVDESFAQFWSIYPVKAAKPQCRKKWGTKACQKIAEKIIADVIAKTKGDQKWLEGFAPNPLTYLNQERWNDPIRSAANANSSSGGKLSVVEQTAVNIRNAAAAAATEAARAGSLDLPLLENG